MPPPTGLEICSNRPGKIGLTVSPLSLTLECSSRLGSSSCPWSRWLSPSCCSPGTRTLREDSLPLKKAKVHTSGAFLALDTLESEVERFLFIFRFSFPHSGVLPTWMWILWNKYSKLPPTYLPQLQVISRKWKYGFEIAKSDFMLLC